MKKVLLILLTVLVGGVFGGAGKAGAFYNPSFERETCYSEPGYSSGRDEEGNIMTNYIDLDVQYMGYNIRYGDINVVQPDADMISGVKGIMNSMVHRAFAGIEYPVTQFLPRGADAILVTPVCQGASSFTWELEKIWAITITEDELGFTQRAVDISDRDAALSYGIRIPDGERKEVASIPLGQRARFSGEADISPTPYAPDVRGLEDGGYRFDYLISVLGYKSNRAPEVEQRKVRIYLEKSSIPLDERSRFAGGRERLEEGIRTRYDEMIGSADVGTNYHYSPQEARMWLGYSGEREDNLSNVSTFTPFTPAPAASSCGRRDVNGDGVVNIIDLVTVARRFGQRNPIPRIAGNTVPWAPEDVNNDGVINIIDLVTVARQFGQSCPPTTVYVPAGERVVFVPIPITKQPQNTGFASVLKSIFWVIGE